MNMLYVVLFVFSLSKGCQADANNSAIDQSIPPPVPTAPPAPPTPLVVERRGMSQDLANRLRHQLMRDNYDYQTGTDDERKKRNKQKGVGEPQILRTVDVAKNSNTFSADRDQNDEHNKRHAREHTYPRESHYTSERRDTHDHSSDQDLVPDGVDPADTHGTPTAYDMRDALAPNSPPDRRDNTQDTIESYNPIYRNQKHDAYKPSNLSNEIKVAPRGDPQLRANAQDVDDADYTADRYVADHRQEEHAQDNPDTQYIPDTRDNSDQQDASDTQAESNQKTEFTEIKASMQAAYDSLEVQGMKRPLVTRPNLLKHYEPKRPPPRDHNISKKDLLYYMDDDQLRRNNDVSADQSLTNASKTNQPVEVGTGRTDRYRSKVVTVSPSNVTYKLLRVKSRDGRRSGSHRFLEEHAPARVSLISLDHAPFPPLRLPRSRRQYMH